MSEQSTYFEVTESSGRLAYWRTDDTARRGGQVEHLHPDGSWQRSLLFETAEGFRRAVAAETRREITAEEVPA